MSIDHVVVDVEIQKTIEETPGGWNATDLLGVAVACVWEYRNARMRVYGPEDVPALRERLLLADRITGFNILRFDFPVIWSVPKSEWHAGHPVYDQLLPRTDDLLRRIWQARGLDADRFGPGHQGWGLDAVAGQTLNARKIGHGADAPRWYQQGLIQRVVNYCSDDVALERDLGDFIDRHGYAMNEREMVRIPAWKPEGVQSFAGAGI